MVTFREIVEGCKLNLLFLNKSLSSPLNEVHNNLDSEVRTWDKLEALGSFDSTDKVVEDYLDKNKSGLDLGGEGDRSFKDEVIDSRKSTACELLDRDSSSFDGSEDKEDSSGEVNSFFQTKYKLDWSR